MTTPPRKPPALPLFPSDEPVGVTPVVAEGQGKIISRRAADLIRSAASNAKEPASSSRQEPVAPALKPPTGPQDRSSHPLYQIANTTRSIEDDEDYVYRDPLESLEDNEPLMPIVEHKGYPEAASHEDDDDGYVTLAPAAEAPEEVPSEPVRAEEQRVFVPPVFELEVEPVPPSGLEFLEQLDLSPPPPLSASVTSEVEGGVPAMPDVPASTASQAPAMVSKPGATPTATAAQPVRFGGLVERDPHAIVTDDALAAEEIEFLEEDINTAEALGVTVNKQYVSEYVPEAVGLQYIGTPEQLSTKLRKVGYQCLDFIAVQISLILNTPTNRIRALILEGPSGCGKSFMAKSLAKITGAELMTLSCYKGMRTENLVEYPSTLAMANAMTGKGGDSAAEMLKLGVIARAFLKSQEKPVILLIDELDKPEGSIDTFFLGPIQDARIWLESRPPIDANINNLLILFTKNFNRAIDEALLRRCHPVKMTYLDSMLERRILSPHCDPQLVANLVTIADRMRNSTGSYQFERPPAPEELLTAAHYIKQLLDWGISEFAFVGRNLWAMLAKSEHDRAVLDHMLRFHPDFMDPLFLDARHAPQDVIYARFGRIILDKIVSDPDSLKREKAWKELEYN